MKSILYLNIKKILRMLAIGIQFLNRVYFANKMLSFSGQMNKLTKKGYYRIKFFDNYTPNQMYVLDLIFVIGIGNIFVTIFKKKPGEIKSSNFISRKKNVIFILAINSKILSKKLFSFHEFFGLEIFIKNFCPLCIHK